MFVLDPPLADEIGRLIAVSRGREPADMLFTGGRVLNVYSGEVLEANVAVAGQRIAYVGPSERPVGPSTQVVELKGRVLAPGYFEPHCHPYVVYNPVEYCRAVVPRGTTTVVADDIFLFQVLEQDGFEALLRDLRALPLRILWAIRTAAERAVPNGATEEFPAERITRSLDLPDVIQTGELTSWPALLGGSRGTREAISRARSRGMRIDGHLAGCSYDTVAALAAAGVSADHESITSQEVVNRVRLGLHAMLRYQSLRPDLPELLRGLRDQPLPTSRLMLTTDGSSPTYYADGYSERLVRIAMETGVAPMTAYQMASMNPAVYFGLDADVGGIAPGRYADILVLSDADHPEPELVFNAGRLVARDGELLDDLPRIDWSRYGFSRPEAPAGWRPEPDVLRAPHGGGPFPVMRLDGPAIVRREDRHLPARGGRVALDGGGLLYGALVDRNARWVAQGVLEGFGSGLEGFASSFTGSLDVLACGNDPAAMALAVEAVFRQGGGIVIVERGETLFSLPLPIGGLMSDLRMPELIGEITRLQRLLAERGHPYHDPIYTLLFLSSDALPDLRLTPAGLFEVKSRRIVLPPEPL